MHPVPRSLDAVLARLRRALVFISVVMTLVGVHPALAASPDHERTGTTETSAGNSPNEAPLDAPRLGTGSLTEPPVPPRFNTFDGGWIRFHYHPSNREHVLALISESTVIRRELAERLGVPVLGRVRVDVARTPGEMATFAPAGAPYPDYAAGVAYPELGLVLLSLAPVHPNADHDLVQVFRHELAHVALFDAAGGAHVPRWFNEGFAVFASGESSFTRLRTLWTATVADKLIPLERLDAGFPANESDAEIAYAEAVDVVRYLVRHRERFRFQGLVERLRAGQEFAAALKEAYGIDLVELEQEWREDVAKRYTFWPVLFSGSVVWVGVLGLFVVGWRKRKQRARVILARWAEEEARDDASRARAEAMSGQRVHIVLARSPQLAMPPPPSEGDVPKIQHDGQWHTLH
jgi:hypothetical protein